MDGRETVKRRKGKIDLLFRMYKELLQVNNADINNLIF